MPSHNMPRRYRGLNRSIALSMLNLGARGGLVVNPTPRPLYPRERAPVPIMQDPGGAAGPVWTDVEKVKSLAATGFRTPKLSVHNESLCQLRCLGPQLDN
jgi:hypothetical protein